VVTVNEFVELF